MKYFQQNMTGFDVVRCLREINNESDCVVFITEYMQWLSTQDGNPNADKRVVERSIFYCLGVLRGSESESGLPLATWKKIINNTLYPSTLELQESMEHRLIETGE